LTLGGGVWQPKKKKRQTHCRSAKPQKFLVDTLPNSSRRVKGILGGILGGFLTDFGRTFEGTVRALGGGGESSAAQEKMKRYTWKQAARRTELVLYRAMGVMPEASAGGLCPEP